MLFDRISSLWGSWAVGVGSGEWGCPSQNISSSQMKAKVKLLRLPSARLPVLRGRTAEKRVVGSMETIMFAFFLSGLFGRNPVLEKHPSPARRPAARSCMPPIPARFYLGGAHATHLAATLQATRHQPPRTQLVIQPQAPTAGSQLEAACFQLRVPAQSRVPPRLRFMSAARCPRSQTANLASR